MISASASILGTGITDDSGTSTSPPQAGSGEVGRKIRLRLSPPATLVGVMVSVAMLPPAATLGIMAAAYEPSLAFGAAMLLGANVACVNIAARVVFMTKGISTAPLVRTHECKKGYCSEYDHLDRALDGAY